MSKIFNANIFILLFSISGFFSPVGASYYTITPDKIELLQSVTSGTTTLELKEFSTPKSEEDYSTSLILIDYNIQIILKNRLLTYRNIRANIEAKFITSHQTNALPQHTS